jgi:hypothetical protein
VTKWIGTPENLEDMLWRVGGFMPVVSERLMPLFENKIEILVRVSRDQNIMKDTLLVAIRGTPSVSIQSFQKSKACAVYSWWEINLGGIQRDYLNEEVRTFRRIRTACGGIAKRKVHHRGVIVG